MRGDFHSHYWLIRLIRWVLPMMFTQLVSLRARLPHWIAATSTLVTLFGLGCGDSLATEAYRGEPRIVLRGSIESLERMPMPGEQIFVTAVWEGLDMTNSRETLFGTPAPITTSSFPAEFEAALFDEPPAGAFIDFSLRNCPANVIDALEAEAPLYHGTTDRSWPLEDEAERVGWLVAPSEQSSFPQQRVDFPILDSLGIFPSSVSELQGYVDCGVWALELRHNPQLRQRSASFQGSGAAAKIVVFADTDGNGQLTINSEVRDVGLLSDSPTISDEILGEASEHALAFFRNLNADSIRRLTDGAEAIAEASGSELPRNGFQLTEGVCTSDRTTNMTRIVPVETTRLTILNEADRDRLYEAGSHCSP